MKRGTLMLFVNFFIAIALVPIGVELFTLLGVELLGDAILSLHPWMQFVFAYIPILFLLWIYLKATLEPLEHFGIVWSKQYLWTSMGLGALSGIVMFLVSSATDAWASFNYLADPTLLQVFGFLLVMAVLIPVTEEVLFRGMIQTIFLDKFSGTTWWHPAILIASLYEVMMHLSVPYYQAEAGMELAAIVSALPQAAYVLVFGFIGGVVYYRTRSLVGPILIHALGNGLELVIFWLLV